MKQVLSLVTDIVRLTKTIEADVSHEDAYPQWYSKEIPEGTQLLRTIKVVRHEEVYPASLTIFTNESLTMLDRSVEWSPYNEDDRFADAMSSLAVDSGYDATMFVAACSAEDILRDLLVSKTVSREDILQAASNSRALKAEASQ